MKRQADLVARRTILAGIISSGTLIFLAGCDRPAPETEDCDAEDLRNREPECGFPEQPQPRTTPGRVSVPRRPSIPANDTDDSNKRRKRRLF